MQKFIKDGDFKNKSDSFDNFGQNSFSGEIYAPCRSF